MKDKNENNEKIKKAMLNAIAEKGEFAKSTRTALGEAMAKAFLERCKHNPFQVYYPKESEEEKEERKEE